MSTPDAESTKATLAKSAASWLLGQPFNNVLLVAILWAIGYGGYFLINTGIPAHLRTIQDGYERLAVQHSTERQTTESNHTRQIERIVTGYEKAIDRDRQLMEHIIGESGTEKKSVSQQ